MLKALTPPDGQIKFSGSATNGNAHQRQGNAINKMPYRDPTEASCVTMPSSWWCS
jgi:hypothetical protein